jgi:hypothetical protein
MKTIALALLFVAASVHAQPPSPNSLPAEEVRDGWVLLFDGETTFGWSRAEMGPKGSGVLLLEKNFPAQCNTVMPANSEVTFEVRGKVRVSLGDGALASQVTVGKDNGDWSFCRYTTKFDKGSADVLFFEGARKILDGLASPSPEINFRLGFNALDKQAEVRAIKMRPLQMKPLFNGRNLDGWKVFPGKKSKFDVEDGAIQIVNGPGDLQTTSQFENFWLQLECKSNGKHLNSGVFFRCRANEYQNGYEAQIQNGFGPEKEYVVDIFDPKSHELIEKKKVKSAAIDFGTGAIYRRVPARKEVAKDGEWFTMTVAAHGNHFATWVNGIQQVDWTDNRPPSDNARNGYRREAGHISLQGHDATTNLSFRNFRIAELPAEK